MHHALATYFHGAPALPDAGLFTPALLALPVIGTAVAGGTAWARRRKTRRS